jgi:Uma2 family endonuclease
MNAPFRPEPPDAQEHRFTIDDVVRLSEQGYLPSDRRIELVDGRIEIMAVDGDLHDYALQKLSKFFDKRVYGTPELDAAWEVRTKGALRISPHNAREPDLMITSLFDEVRMTEPRDVGLLIETSVSSKERDLKEKRLVYADAGIREYWVWDAEQLALHVFRNPENGNYAEHQVLRTGESISPLFAPEIVLAVEALIPSPRES